MRVPSRFAGGDDGRVAVPDETAELVCAEVFPDVFHWVQLGCIGRQWEEGYVLGTCKSPPV